MAFLYSDWLCCPWHGLNINMIFQPYVDIDQLPDPTVLYNLLDAASNSTPCLPDAMALVTKDEVTALVCDDSVSPGPQSPAISETGCSTDEGIQSDISEDLEYIDG